MTDYFGSFSSALAMKSHSSRSMAKSLIGFVRVVEGGRALLLGDWTPPWEIVHLFARDAGGETGVALTACSRPVSNT
jgi:hypothetical protein